MKYIFIIPFLILLVPSKGYSFGCNFGITNTLIVGATHSYTIGQGPWGVRKYTWNWGDGSAPNTTYSDQNNFTSSSHTYSDNGIYTLSINACDSASGAGCLSYGNFTISVNGIATGLSENNPLNKIQVYPNPFSNHIVVENENFNKIEVRNYIGELMLSESFSDISYYKLNTENLCSGIYFIYVFNNRKQLNVFRSFK
jgi:hypothetical protein